MPEFILKPWHLLALLLASHLNQEQRRIIEYPQARAKCFGRRWARGAFC